MKNKIENGYYTSEELLDLVYDNNGENQFLEFCTNFLEVKDIKWNNDCYKVTN